MKTNDYVKYMTQQFVKYIDTPRDERKNEKRCGRNKNARFTTLVRYFTLWFQAMAEAEKITANITNKVLQKWRTLLIFF